MRLRTLIPVGIAGTALYAARNTKLVRQQLVAPIAGVASSALGRMLVRVETFAQPDPKSARARQLEDEASLDDLDIASHEIIDQLSSVEPMDEPISSEMPLSRADLAEVERALIAPSHESSRRR